MLRTALRAFPTGLTLLLAALLLANLYCYHYRGEGFLFTKAFSHDKFYVPYDAARIKNFSLRNDTLHVSFRACTASAYTVALPLKNGQQVFEIRSDCLIPDSLIISYDQARQDVFVESSTLPVTNDSLESLAFWTASHASEDYQEIRKIISEEIILPELQRTRHNVITLGAHLLKKLKSAEGEATVEMKTLSPLEQYRRAISGKGKVDCAVYSDIFCAWANAAGIPTRKIGLSDKFDGVNITGHVMNECFLEETHQWACVDLTNNMLLAFSENGTALNAMDLLHLSVTGTSGNVYAHTVKDDKPDTVSYRVIQQMQDRYFKSSALVYAIADQEKPAGSAGNFKEYLSEKPHGFIFHGETLMPDNGKHYLKRFLFFALLITALLWIIRITIRLILRRNHI